MNDIMTLSDVAEALHLEKHTASKIMKQMNYIRITERIILVTREEFNNYLEKMTVKNETNSTL